MLAEREAIVAAKELGEQLERERVDVTLPGAVIPRGGLHLLTQTRREIEDIFIGLGYDIAEGPEIELEYNNFAALNFSDDHPGEGGDRHAVDRARRLPAHAHLAGAGPDAASAGAADLRDRAGPRVPPRHA